MIREKLKVAVGEGVAYIKGTAIRGPLVKVPHC